MPRTPIAYFVFNRPELTRRSFERIRRQRPERLFVVADGPRDDVPGDRSRCEHVRKLVTTIDWPCDAEFDFADQNMGLSRRIISGLNWVFSEAPHAIVLEDDCVASGEFFSFCDALLERYAEDDRVGVITGNNYQAGRDRGQASYYFSRYNHVWGWASWARAWECFDRDLSFWPEWKHSEDWRRAVPDAIERHYWERIFDRVAAGRIDSWDYSWTASLWYAGMLTATPNANLVKNIGFGPDSTHTKAPSAVSALEIQTLGDLTHPDSVVRDDEADRFAFRHHFGGYRLRAHYPKLARVMSAVRHRLRRR